MARQVFEALVPLALCCALFAMLANADQNDPKQTGPVALVIQYKCLPRQRGEFRQRLAEENLRRFAQLKSDSVLADYRILFSRYVDTNLWDALALLTFRRYEDAARWRKVEEATPAGLSQEALALTTSIETYPADLMRQAQSEQAAPQAVYLVVPYSFSIPVPAYLKYVDDYVSPQFKGWMEEGILTSYQVYLQRYAAGRPWDTLIFLKYKDDESLGQRETVVAKIRAQLQSNAVWKAASDNKQSLRVEKEAVIADELTSVH